MSTIIDSLASQARELFTDCYTLTVERDHEQLYMGDIDNVTLGQAMQVYERNRAILHDSEPVGTSIRLVGLHGCIASDTVA